MFFFFFPLIELMKLIHSRCMFQCIYLYDVFNQNAEKLWNAYYIAMPTRCARLFQSCYLAIDVVMSRNLICSLSTFSILLSL